VAGNPAHPVLVHSSGLRAVPEPTLTLPGPGTTVQLCPVDVTWDPNALGSFPLLVCDSAPRQVKAWRTATVRRRTAPMTLELLDNGGLRRVQFPLGGVVPGETVLVHASSGRVLGRLLTGDKRTFSPDEPVVLRILSPLPRGGALAANSTGTRGLVTTDQVLAAGDRIPAVQIDLKPRGPVWAAIGTPLPR
jgi:hypothetical protein